MTVQILEALKAYGCDTDTALERFLNNADMYIRFLNKFREDKSFEDIKRNLSENNGEEAFKSTHTLKGVAGNLGLTPLFDITAYMVTKYREGAEEQAWSRFHELEETYYHILDILNQYY